jgi:methionyl-tRNA formyltransferase
MKIIFFGEDAFSAHVLTSLIYDNHQILGVFSPIYQNHIYARLQLVCNKHDIEFHRIEDINSEANESVIRKLKPDIITVCHFQKVLKKNIIEIPKYGCINLHPSLLPKYRGLSPQHWPIINGDDETGITIHFINENIDTGDIILQHKIKIEPDMYVSDLQIKMLDTYKTIVKDAVRLIAQNKVRSVSQNPSEGSYFGKLKESHCNINLDKGCINAYNLIKGLSEPYFGARFKAYKIWRASMASKELDQKIQNKYKDNNIYFDKTMGALIKFNDGSLILKKFDKMN